LLVLTPEAIGYIKEKQQPIYLDHPPLSGENSQMKIKPPPVKFGVPQNPNDFTLHEEPGVSVYVPRGLEVVQITVELSGILFLKKLMARVAVAKR
jgi:hypothetical protein